MEHYLIKTEVKEEPVMCDEETEMDTSICVEHMKCEVSENEPDMEADALEHIQDDESQELIDEDDVKYELLEDMIDIEEHELKCEDLQNEKSWGVDCINSTETKGAKTSETRGENIEHVYNVTPGGRNNSEKLTRLESKTVKKIETPSRTKGPYTLRKSRNGKKQVSTNTSKCSDTTTNNSNIRVNSDNDGISTNDLDNNSSKRVTNMFIDCDVFDGKYKHTKYQNIFKGSPVLTSGVKSSHQHATLHRQRLSNVNDTEVHCGNNSSESDICQEKKTRNDDLKKHLRTHTGNKPFECEKCKVRFSRKAHLNIHLVTHTGEKPFECEICKVRFSQKAYLNIHLRTHTGEKPFECEICKVRFSQKANLNIHLKTHTGEKPFECEKCKVRFSRKADLKRHLLTHTGMKFFKCEICKVKFRGHLKTHLRAHTGETPFECEICKVRFSQKAHLNEHLRTHTGEKPFECEICKVRFNQKPNLHICELTLVRKPLNVRYVKI